MWIWLSYWQKIFFTPISALHANEHLYSLQVVAENNTENNTNMCVSKTHIHHTGDAVKTMSNTPPPNVYSAQLKTVYTAPCPHCPNKNVCLNWPYDIPHSLRLGGSSRWRLIPFLLIQNSTDRVSDKISTNSSSLIQFFLLDRLRSPVAYLAATSPAWQRTRDRSPSTAALHRCGKSRK